MRTPPYRGKNLKALDSFRPDWNFADCGKTYSALSRCRIYSNMTIAAALLTLRLSIAPYRGIFRVRISGKSSGAKLGPNSSWPKMKALYRGKATSVRLSAPSAVSRKQV